MTRLRCLNGNLLKIIAAVCMVIDHVGLMFFPENILFRIIGRIAFPIFAFMISEGARYTKNRLRYFVSLLSLAVICQTVYYFFGKSLYMCVLVTFTLSLGVIFALRAFKKAIFDCNASVTYRILTSCVLILSLMLVFVANYYLDIDYGVCGCLLPVFASIFDFRGIHVPVSLKKLDTLTVRVLTFSIGMIIMSVSMYSKYNALHAVQPFMMIALPLLFAYSGSRGKYKMKYFFYIFYPLHLALLEGVYILIYYILR